MQSETNGFKIYPWMQSGSRKKYRQWGVTQTHTHTHTSLNATLVWSALLSGAGDVILCMRAYVAVHRWSASVKRRKARGPLFKPRQIHSWKWKPMEFRLLQYRRKWTFWEWTSSQSISSWEPAERATVRETRLEIDRRGREKRINKSKAVLARACRIPI